MPTPPITPSATPKPAFNDAESPLTWLRARRDRTGQPLISDAQYLAGERLRMDFERAMLARRTTTNWDMAGAGGRGGASAAELSDGAIAARFASDGTPVLSQPAAHQRSALVQTAGGTLLSITLD